MESPSAFIGEKIKGLRDWRGKALATVRSLIHDADPQVVEEVKWMGTPVWSHEGIICTGEIYKNVVKLTFPKGASLADPSGLFNSSLDGNARRAIDIHEDDINEGEPIHAAAFKKLVRAAVEFNLQGKAKKSSISKTRASKPKATKPRAKPRAKSRRSPRKG